MSTVADYFGSQCIVVAIDARRTNAEQWEIFTHGGRRATGIDALKWAKQMADFGAGELLITSMDKDGTKSGFDNELLAKTAGLVNIPIIASGGVGNLEHFLDGIKIGKADAVLAASIFHFGEYTIAQAKEFLHSAGVAVRLDY